MSGPVVFDLTELLLASTGKTRFYGIARTVAEIGGALARIAPPVRFSLHSAAHDRFFEITASTAGDRTAFDVPVGLRQWRVRSVHPVRRPLHDAGSAILRAVANARSRRTWAQAGVELPDIDLSGATLVSCASPKVIVEQLATLDRRRIRVRLVPLLHDMMPIHDRFEPRRADFPAKFVADNAHIIRRAERLLANSAFTRDEILRFAGDGTLPGLPEGGVHVVPLVHECSVETGPVETAPPDGPYILTVGAMLGRKNLEASLDALSLMRGAGGPVPRLVVAGARRKTTDEHLASDARADIRDLVEVRHSPSQAELVALYRGAVATVVASRMEGWGLPAGESLWLGTPAICADVPALREVAGDLGLYFDPDAPDALADYLCRLITDGLYTSALRRKIAAAHPTLRTWNDVAHDLLSALEREPSGPTR